MYSFQHFYYLLNSNRSSQPTYVIFSFHTNFARNKFACFYFYNIAMIPFTVLLIHRSSLKYVAQAYP